MELGRTWSWDRNLLGIGRRLASNKATSPTMAVTSSDVGAATGAAVAGAGAAAGTAGDDDFGTATAALTRVI